MSRASAGASTSTAAVLWLMILLVFLPIAAAHVLARHVVEPAAGPAIGQHGDVSGAG